MGIYKLLVWILLSIVVCSCSKESSIEPHYKVIAHRGFWKDADGADNSLAGLKEAARLGVDGVELDVSCTLDDSLVVIHGPKHGDYTISQTDFATLRKIRLSNGELIPTLSEYLDCYISLGSPFELFVELKHKNEEAKVLNTIRKYNLIDRVKFMAFGWDICKKLRTMDSTIHISCLNGSKSPQEIKNAKMNGVFYEIYDWKNHPEWLSEARKLGLATDVWVVKTESDLIWSAENSLDYVTTDSPLEAKQFKSNYE